MTTETDQPQAAHSPPLAWAKLYHRSGLDVRIPIPVNGQPLAIDTCRNVLASVDNLLAAGWLTQAPGLEEGETKLMAEAAVLRNHQNKDNTVSPLINLYFEGDKFSRLNVYLDKPDEVQDFERASGLKVSAMRPYIGTGKLERGASRDTDALFAIAPKPFAVCMVKNPKYNPDEKELKLRKPQFLFARWPDLPAKQENGKPPEPEPPGGVIPDGMQKTLERAMTDSGAQLQDTADTLARYWANSTPTGRPWYAHFVAVAFHRLMLEACKLHDLQAVATVLKTQTVKNPGMISEPWVDYLRAYYQQRLKEVS